MSAEVLGWIERGGGFALAILMLYGLYKLSRYAIDKLGVPLVTGIVATAREMLDELKAIVAELKEMRLEAAERHGNLREHITTRVTKAKHDLANALQVKVLYDDEEEACLESVPPVAGDDDEKTPVGGIRRPTRGRGRGGG